MTHQEFKDAARQHQIDFKVNDHEINVPADRFPIRFMKRNGKEYRIDVRSSLTWKDAVYARVALPSMQMISASPGTAASLRKISANAARQPAIFSSSMPWDTRQSVASDGSP